MNENLIHNEIEQTKKEKLLKFYNSNKILIFSSLSLVLVLGILIIFYLESQDKKREIVAQNYVSAKIFIEKNDKTKAKNILKEIVFSDNSIYSSLSFFLLLKENLISDEKEKSELFEHIIKNNNFSDEIKNLIIFKKALFESSFISESDLLASLNPLLNGDSIWKPHAILLVGDYFYSKEEYSKAREFYTKILSLKNINNEFYQQARSQLTLMINE